MKFKPSRKFSSRFESEYQHTLFERIIKKGGICAINFLDTNAILNGLNTEIVNEPFLISSVTLMELEHIKTSGRKSEEVKYKARKAVRFLDKHPDLYTTIYFTEDVASILSEYGLPEDPDNKICACCEYWRRHNSDVVFISDDLCCKLIAKDIFKLSVTGLPKTQEEVYKGYKLFKGTTEQINESMSNINFDDWYCNEYLIIRNTDDSTVKEMRFDGEKFVSLKLPPSKFIKGKNALQRCALDMLMNPDITIAALLGTYGSGKTYLAMQMGLYAIQEKGRQAKMLGVREIIGEGKEPGYLPGDLDNKVGSFFDPLAHSLNGGIFELESLKQSGVLETNIPHFMKGTTYNDTIVLCDEAEDLTEKQLRLIGTRLGNNSRIFFSGDYRQSLLSTSSQNALAKMCNSFKGESNFGCIYLNTDVRSDTSRMFADLFYKE